MMSKNNIQKRNLLKISKINLNLFRKLLDRNISYFLKNCLQHSLGRFNVMDGEYCLAFVQIMFDK